MEKGFSSLLFFFLLLGLKVQWKREKRRLVVPSVDVYMCVSRKRHFSYKEKKTRTEFSFSNGYNRMHVVMEEVV